MSKNEMQVFQNDEFGEVRAVMRDGEPWFVAADVCRVLEITNNRDAVARLDDDEKGVASTDTLRWPTCRAATSSRRRHTRRRMW